jgi:Tol biopolymer transport system component
MRKDSYISGFLFSFLVISLAIGGYGCTMDKFQSTAKPEVPHKERWGIYALNLNTFETRLIYSSPNRLTTLRLNDGGDRFVFSQRVGGDTYNNEEIFTIEIDGQSLHQLTENDLWDIYPAWSPNGDQIAYLSMRIENLDIYHMDSDGSRQELLYDSGFHDADIHWSGDQIVFTSQSQIRIMKEDGTEARTLTDPPRSGEWGNANLPFGDYDPRINPQGTHVLFSRMVDDRSSHGNYDLFLVNIESLEVTRLTSTSHSQGLSSWSHSGEIILYIVAAIDDIGKYDIYRMNSDGTDLQNITPDYFPPEFLCQFAVFSLDDTEIYFIGEWWSEG